MNAQSGKGGLRQIKHGGDNKITAFPTWTKLLLEAEERTMALQPVKMVREKSSRLALTACHLLIRISQRHQSQAHDLRSTRLEALDSTHQQKFNDAWRCIRKPAHQI